MKRHYGAKLVLTEVLRGQEEEDRQDYTGPAGYNRGKQDAEARHHVFGTFVGHVAVLSDYNTFTELH